MYFFGLGLLLMILLAIPASIVGILCILIAVKM